MTQADIDAGSYYPINTVLLEFDEPVHRAGAENGTEVGHWVLSDVFDVTIADGSIDVLQIWLVDSAADAEASGVAKTVAARRLGLLDGAVGWYEGKVAGGAPPRRRLQTSSTQTVLPVSYTHLTLPTTPYV